MKPKALDLFCGGGGAARGLIAAGFDVVGIDYDPRCKKWYPGDFIEWDLTKGCPVVIETFDMAWASPPCQRFTPGNNAQPELRETLPDHLDLARSYLAQARYSVLENVPEAPVRRDLVLEGPMFGLDELRRRRAFELNFFILQPIPEQNSQPVVTVLRKQAFRNKPCRWSNRNPRRREYVRSAAARRVMGFPPGVMSRAQVGEAIPPAYAEYIGRQVVRLLERDDTQ